MPGAEKRNRELTSKEHRDIFLYLDCGRVTQPHTFVKTPYFILETGEFYLYKLYLNKNYFLKLQVSFYYLFQIGLVVSSRGGTL